jgi:hypothetical protein
MRATLNLGSPVNASQSARERNDIGNETNPIGCSFVKRLDAGRRPGDRVGSVYREVTESHTGHYEEKGGLRYVRDTTAGSSPKPCRALRSSRTT